MQAADVLAIRASLSMGRSSEETLRAMVASPSTAQADAGGWAFQSRRHAGERQRRCARELSRDGSGSLRDFTASRPRDMSFYAAMGELGARHSCASARDCARVSSTRSSQDRRTALLDRRRSVSTDACAPAPVEEFSNPELLHRVTLFVGS